MEESLKILVEKARSGDRVAWNGIIIRMQRRVFVAALAVAGNVEEADDVTQEAFVKLFGKISSIENPEAVGGWLVRTAINIAHDRKRFERLRGWFGIGTKDAESESARDASPETQVANAEMARVIDGWSRARLSERERVVVQLRAGEGMKVEEIARELGISPSTVKTHLARAREKLGPFLKRGGR